VVCTATVLELLDPEDEGALALRNVAIYTPHDKAPHPRRLESSALPIKGKVRFHPVAGHTGPEGEYRYSSTLSWPRH
jgi:hypothetical protein